RVTISADNNIVITGNLKYQGGTTGSDVLGLIAENSVKIYHPVGRVCTLEFWGRCWAWGDDGNLDGPDGNKVTNPVVHASILTLQHSFTVQAYDKGAPLGDLTVFGSIAQRYRGPVGTGGSSISTGYYKDYNYDTRLRYAPPPYFLDPVQSA